MQQPVLLSPEFGAKPQLYAQLTVWPCQDELFVNNPRDIRENDEYALDFAFFFWLGGNKYRNLALRVAGTL
jgi:hypothetical protein